MDLKEAALLGDGAARHWYYRAKSEALLRVLGGYAGTVHDVGAGTGFFARVLLEHGAAAAVCIDPGYEAESDQSHASRPLAFRRTPPVEPAGLVLMMDVLEHVDDDAGLLRAYVAAAAPGTRFVLTVPAFRWLWSQHDEFLEHRRRYTRGGLVALMRHAGLEVTGARYLYGLILPLAAATRLPERLRGPIAVPKSQMRPVGRLTNAALLALCRAEALLPGNRVAGVSVMAWGRTAS